MINLEQKVNLEKAIREKRNKDIVKWKYTAYLIAYTKIADEFGIIPTQEDREEFEKVTKSYQDYIIENQKSRKVK